MKISPTVTRQQPSQSGAGELQPAGEPEPTLISHEEPRDDISPLPQPERIPPSQASEPSYSYNSPKAEQPVEAESKEPAKPRLTEKDAKTEAVKEKLLRYYIDPNLQIEEILQSIDNFYSSSECPPRLKSHYDTINTLIETGTIAANELSAWTKDSDFQRLLGVMAGIATLRETIFNIPYSSKEKYSIDPYYLLAFSQFSSAAISPDLLLNNKLPAEYHGSTQDAISAMATFAETGKTLLQTFSTANHPSKVKKILRNAPTGLHLPAYQSKHFYPVLLSQTLGFHSYEASLYAIAQGFSLLAIGRSERGLHGGSYHEPLVVLFHDLVHFHRFLAQERSGVAFRLRNLASTLLHIIHELELSSNEREQYFLMTHFLFHESDPVGFGPLEKYVNSPLEVLDCLFALFDLQVQSEDDLGVRIGSIEHSNIYIRIFKQVGKDTQDYDQDIIKTKEKQKKLIDGSLLRGTAFSWDSVAAVLKIKSKAERDALHKILFPGFPETRKGKEVDAAVLSFEEKIVELRKIHNLSQNAEPTAAYLHDLYLWKAASYNAYAGYKIIRDFMSEMKEKISPFIQFIPTPDASKYKNHLEIGKEISES